MITSSKPLTLTLLFYMCHVTRLSSYSSDRVIPATLRRIDRSVLTVADLLFGGAVATMESCSVPEALSAKYTGSFAYKTVKDRMPMILTKVIDALHRNRHKISQEHGEVALEELKTIIGQLAKLRNELQTDKKFLKLADDYSDAVIWNEALETLDGGKNSWFTEAWLFAECYMYRRVLEVFQLSEHLKDVDPFRYQKNDSLHSVITHVESVCTVLDEILNLKDEPIEVLKENFTHLMQLSLWGNKCDLSISSGNVKQGMKNPLNQLEELNPYLLANDIEDVWQILQPGKQEHRNGKLLDIVLDNSGFELFTDLTLAEYLTSKELVHTVRFYVKDFPWFVSDATTEDFTWVIQTLQSHEDKMVSSFGHRCKKRLDKGQWKIVKSNFWTLPFGFSKMKSFDKELYDELSEADLIFFKGDLNYRKLFDDLNWEHSVSFNDALRQFRPSSLCSLRTLKAEIVVGLEKKQVEELESAHNDWLFSGDYAVIQCSKNVI